MTKHYTDVNEVAQLLNERLQTMDLKADILKAPELKSLYEHLKTLPVNEKAIFGQQVNSLRQNLQRAVSEYGQEADQRPDIDITAPFDLNIPLDHHPYLLSADQGSHHPLTTELQIVLDIFYRMGFTAVEAPEIDDDFHMFESLNFPEGHPARDDYDTFMTVQKNSQGKPFIAPAHTSTMQHRVLKEFKDNLEHDQPIAAVIPGRVFRNEDIDSRHEHTFYQLEGVYVGKNINTGNLIATLKTFLQAYYQQDLRFKTQPFYFPFTEPSFEFVLGCPFCQGDGCHICSQSGWIELLGCGLIHPNVLSLAGIDPTIYSGFAWGGGIERLVMMKYGIEDIRHFESGKLEFLRMFV